MLEAWRAEWLCCAPPRFPGPDIFAAPTSTNASEPDKSLLPWVHPQCWQVPQLGTSSRLHVCGGHSSSDLVFGWVGCACSTERRSTANQGKSSSQRRWRMDTQPRSRSSCSHHQVDRTRIGGQLVTMCGKPQSPWQKVDALLQDTIAAPRSCRSGLQHEHLI